jgi:PAB1-binding protein PBP1
MQNQFIDLYRNSIKTTTEAARSYLENTVRIHQRQLDMAKTALEESSRSAQQVTEAKSFEDLVSLQSRLAGAQIERMAEFWSSLWHAAAEQQKAMIEQVQSQMGQAKDRVRETYAFTARTSEEAARVAAMQISRTSDSVRDTTAAHEQPQRRPHEQERNKEQARKSA